MARFNLEKDEAVSMQTIRREFNLDKDDLTRIRVDLTWTGADLDVQAFCLDANDQIIDDADFVFYNSARRTSLPGAGESDDEYMNRIEEVPFNAGVYGSKPNWRSHTAPLSTDNSVIGSFDDRNGGDGETLRIDLNKVRPGIRTILITVTSHGNLTFGEISNASVSFTNVATGDELARYDINRQFNRENALVAAALQLNDGEWEFQAIGEAYEGGLGTLVDTYAP